MQTSHDTQHTCKAQNNLYCMGKSVEFLIIMDCHGTVTGTSVSLLNCMSICLDRDTSCQFVHITGQNESTAVRFHSNGANFC